MLLPLGDDDLGAVAPEVAGDAALLFDPEDTFAPQLGVAVMPTTLLVSPEGVVVKTMAGTVTSDELTAAINEAFPA